MDVGITNADKLTDIAFYLHYPDLEGRPLKLGETELVESWKNFRRLIKPLISAFGKKTKKPTISNLRQTGLSPMNAEPFRKLPIPSELDYHYYRLLDGF